jgi:hypothetical protein
MNITKKQALNYLIDCSGYILEDFEDYSLTELLDLIDENKNTIEFNKYIK